MPKAEAQFAASGGGMRVVGFVGGFGAAAVPGLVRANYYHIGS